jgi:bacillithiol biosynthesis deacetylase BshB1
MKLDLLAFGAHPDDVELSCSGLLLVEKSNGKKTGVVDLTQGELGTRGTIETRYKESAISSEILGLDIRENLQLPDGFFTVNKDSLLKVITIIRKYCPEVVLCTAPEDRHPDHGRAAELVAEACFLSGLMKIETSDQGTVQQPWRPKMVLNYIQDRFLEPDFLVDITPVMDSKIASVRAYGTQFYNPEFSGPDTYISTPEFLNNVIGRCQLLGKRIGVKYAEGFISKKALGVRNLDALIKEFT